MASDYEMQIVSARYANHGINMTVDDPRSGKFTLDGGKAGRGRVVVTREPNSSYAPAVSHQREPWLGDGPANDLIVSLDVTNPATPSVREATEAQIKALKGNARHRDFPKQI